jgi:uncharacterized membrane protein
MPLTLPLAAEQARAVRLRAVPLSRPLSWLRAGLHDFRRCPGPGVLHGAAAWLFGIVLFTLAGDRFWLLAGAFSGFLLVAPIVATALYAVSRALQRGQRIDWALFLASWRPDKPSLMAFGLLLGWAGTGWVVTSAAFITAWAPAPVHSPMDFVRVVVLAREGWLFEAWLLLGAVLAAPVFASSVLTLPLLLDRRIGLWAAVLVSWRCVMDQPVLMAHWAAWIMGLTALAMTPLLLGLPLVLPVLAHASWHAYQDLADASAVPERH